MDNYTKQVNKEHYDSEDYENMPRFSSYFHQQRLLRKKIELLLQKSNSVKILEIGSGSAFLKSYISANYPQVDYKVMDLAEDLSPDFLGDMTQIDAIVQERFDIICAFEVFEHVEYEDAIKTLNKIAQLTGNVIFSIPYVRLYFSMRLKMSVIKPVSFLLSVPFPIQHKFDGQHYWELGTKGYAPKRLRQDLSESYDINQEFSDNLNPWHRFFELTVKK